MATTVQQPALSEPKPGVQWGRVAAWVVLIFILILTLAPFWIVVRTSLTTQSSLFEAPASLLPTDFTWFNFQRALGLASREEMIAAGGSGASLDFLRVFRNSAIFTGLIVVVQTLSSALAAYAFARMRFPGRNVIFFLYLSALMIPGVVLFIPNFILVKELGWLNTFQGMVAPYLLMTPFAVFFLRQFFLSIPRELEEAAHLDGDSTFGIFWRIVLPVSQGPLATLGILTAINSWNDYLWPLLVGRDESVRVLTVALGIFQSQTPQGTPDWTGLMAGTILGVIPIFILLIIMGRQIVESLVQSGLK